MSAAKALTPEQVLAWIADNPDALRLASAQAAADLLADPAVQAVVDLLSSAVAASQDSLPASPGQPRAAGSTGSRESINRILSAIALARLEVAARIRALSVATETA